MKGAHHQKSDKLLPPIRQTASIFNQPVTVVKVSEDQESRVKPDSRQRARQLSDKPRQLFWERRLAGISARSPEVDRLTLPDSVRGLLEEDTSLLASIMKEPGERGVSV